MKIAFYSPLKPFDHKIVSGDRNIARTLIKLLKNLGHEVIIASRFRSYAKKSFEQKIILKSSKNEIDLTLNKMELEQPNLWFTYHNYYKAPDYIGPTVSEKLSIPYIILEASYAKKREVGEWKNGSRSALKSISAANALISFTKRDFIEVNKIFKDKKKNYILPPFPDTSVFYKKRTEKKILKKNFSAKFMIPENTLWILTVAMMRDENSKLESYEILSKSIKLLDQNYSLLIVGNGPKKTYVEKQFEGDINKKVFMLGEMIHSDLANLYNCCEIFAWPGVNEAFGLSYLEAQACGLPIVAGNSGGVPEIIKNNKTGILVDIKNKNPVNFSKALKKLLTDVKLRYSMSTEAENFIKSKRSLKASAAKLNKITLEVLDNYKKINE